MFINNNVSFGMVLFCKCVREFGKVWAFARAEFGMGGTGICPSPIYQLELFLLRAYDKVHTHPSLQSLGLGT